MKISHTLSGIALALSLAGYGTPLLAQSPAETLNFLQVWQKARFSDATWKVAQADADAQREEENKALAGLLPSVGFSASRSRNSTDATNNGHTASYNGYTAASNSLVLRQPLIRVQSYAEYRRAGIQKNMANDRLAAAEQALAVRVAQAYFDVLLADERARFAGFLESSLETRVEAAKRSFRAGVGTTIDIEDAGARLKVARATRLAADNEAENSRKRLSALVDMPIGKLTPMASERLVKEELTPATYAAWQDIARQNSPELAAAIKATEEAAWGVDKARAGHLPTLDLVLARTHTESDTASTISSRYDTNSMGVQLNVPLFSGGYTTSDTAQARAYKARSMAARSGIERELDTKILKEFNGVVQGMQQVAALNQALTASEESLRQTKRGIEAGSRTNIDVLNAEQQLFSVRVESARVRHEAAMSRIRLYAAAGKLNESELTDINAMLTAPAESTPVAAAASTDDRRPQSAREQLEKELNARSGAASAARPAEIAARRPVVLAAASPADNEPSKVTARVLSREPAANPPPPVQPLRPKSEAEIAETARPTASPAPAPVTAMPAKAAPMQAPKNDGKFMILVGSFGMQENVNSMLSRLEKAKVPAFTEDTGKGQTGVRAGPFPSRAAANQALKTLKKADIEGVIKGR